MNTTARQLRDNSTYAHRGMSFQAEINAVNEGYALMKLAAIEEIPIPGRMIRVKGVPTFIRQKSTVDYIGTCRAGIGAWKGGSIAFDAKSTKRQSWPLLNLEPHQLEFLMSWDRCGAITGILLRFELTRRTYWLPLAEQLCYIERAKRGGRKSISEAELAETLRVRSTSRCSMDYLATIEEVAAK